MNKQIHIESLGPADLGPYYENRFGLGLFHAKLHRWTKEGWQAHVAVAQDDKGLWHLMSIAWTEKLLKRTFPKTENPQNPL